MSQIASFKIPSELPFADTRADLEHSKNAVEIIHFTTDGFGADSEMIDASRKGLRISDEKVTVIYLRCQAADIFD